jgi:MerR family transcriptional regulator, light-induced transcriptional regulator
MRKLDLRRYVRGAMLPIDRAIGPRAVGRMVTKQDGTTAGHSASDPTSEAALRADRTPAYNTAAVARRTGLLPATFRAWERRYGFPSPHREPGNQRKYSERDVRALEWLRERLAEGLTIRTALALLRQHLDRPPGQNVPAAARPPAALAEDLERALLAFDEGTAEAVLGEAFALYPLERVCLDVIQPVLIAIGEGWHTGRVDAAQEHFGSALIRRRLAELLRLTTPTGADRLMVAACAPGDWHELGLLTVTLFLARRGWRTVYLGPSLPADNLVAVVERLRPDAVVLSATISESAEILVEVTGRLADRPPPRPLLAFGGQAFEADPALRDAVAGLYLGPDAATAAERLERALARDRL